MALTYRPLSEAGEGHVLNQASVCSLRGMPAGVQRGGLPSMDRKTPPPLAPSKTGCSLPIPRLFRPIAANEIRVNARDTKLFALCIRVLIITELVVSGTLVYLSE